MRGKWGRCGLALALLLVLLAPRPVLAGPFLGDFGWCWHPSGDCQPTEYHWLHYWARNVYILRACFHPSNRDSYAPGLPVPVGAVYFPASCRSVPPAPSAPYADPEGYYGVPTVPPPGTPTTTETTRQEAKPTYAAPGS
jgi:hypothetical protein